MLRVVWKEVGETPLQSLERLRAKEGIADDVPMTYAGRLDPMAEGALIVLGGEECKRRETYLRLDKEYEIDVLVGFSTDTGDVLGLAVADTHDGAVDRRSARRAVRSIIGSRRMPYPAFSSKSVEGKPLYEHALLGTIGDIEIPEREITVYRASLVDMQAVKGTDVLALIASNIALLRVDPLHTHPHKTFRRDIVYDQWHRVIRPDRSYTVLRVRVTASSGAYMRALAPMIAKSIGARGLCLAIKRTRIGRYTPLFRGFGMWLKEYVPL